MKKLIFWAAIVLAPVLVLSRYPIDHLNREFAIGGTLSDFERKFGLEGHYRHSFENDTHIFVSKPSYLTGNTAVYIFCSGHLLDMSFDFEDDPEFSGKYSEFLLDIVSCGEFSEWKK